jgi:hypothetical protein
MAWVALEVEGSEDEAEGTAGGSFGPAASEKVFLEVEGCFLLPATTGTDAGAAADELPEAAAATPAVTLAALDTPLPVSIFLTWEPLRCLLWLRSEEGRCYTG